MNFKSKLSLATILVLFSACGGGGAVVVPISNSTPKTTPISSPNQVTPKPINPVPSNPDLNNPNKPEPSVPSPVEPIPNKPEPSIPNLVEPNLPNTNEPNLVLNLVNTNINKAEIKETYTNLPSIKIENKVELSTKLTSENKEAVEIFSKLYDSSLKTFSVANNVSNYESSNDKANINDVNSRAEAKQSSYGFSPNWNQGFLGNGIIIGINDSGTNDLTNVLFNEHYDYINNTNDKWNSLDNRLNNDNFKSKAYSSSFLKDSNNNPILHGKNVMDTASLIANKIKFANIVSPISEDEKGDKINLAATIDALSNSGVRFFNQSYEYHELDNSSPNTGVFYTAIMKNNALVFNAAGNVIDNINKPFTTHALPTDSPLRKGWVIVLGYKTDAARLDEIGKHFYITDNDGFVKEVYHHGNTCKKYGWDDCISAPFVINGHQGTSYSAPATASVAALIYEKYPWMSNDNIKESLFTTAFKVTSSTSTEDEIKARFGVGILNPARAMNGVAEFRKDFYANVDLDNLYVFSNNIKGSYGLIKDGIGTLVLSGDNTFTGASEIKNGTLWLAGKKNQAHFTNTNGILRLSNTIVSGITNNSVLVNEGVTLGSLTLGANSKIYSNLGESFRVLGNAKLDGEFNLVGVKSGVNIVQGQNVDILTAKSIEDRFKSVQSLVTFLEINEPIYANDKVSVMVKRIDLDKANDLNDFAKKNYQLLFTQLDNYLDYESKKQDKTSNDLAYNKINLDGALSEAEYNLKRADLFYANVLNTTKDKLEENTNKLFATDFYKNSLMNIARVKNIHASALKNNFNIEQSFGHNSIDDLKANSSKTLISNALIKDDLKLAFGFVYDSVNMYNDNFKNDAKTIGLKANLTYDLSNLVISNNLSYLNTLNKTQRFDNFARFYDNSLAYSLKLSYKLHSDGFVSNLFEPYIAINGIYSRQNSFNERGNEFSVGLDSFNKFYSYVNLGFNLNTYFDNLSLSVGTDIEYNFYKDYSLKGRNLNYLNKIEISDGFYKNLVSNANIGIEYLFNNQLKMIMNYKLSYMYNNNSTNKEKHFDFSTDFDKAKNLKNYTNEFMFGINYIF